MRVLFICLFTVFSVAGFGQKNQPLSITLENVEYAYPIHFLDLNFEGQDLRMAYMDIKPTRPNGSSVLLFHGKNFAGAARNSIVAPQ